MPLFWGGFRFVVWETMGSQRRAFTGITFQGINQRSQKGFLEVLGRETSSERAIMLSPTCGQQCLFLSPLLLYLFAFHSAKKGGPFLSFPSLFLSHENQRLLSPKKAPGSSLRRRRRLHGGRGGGGGGGGHGRGGGALPAALFVGGGERRGGRGGLAGTQVRDSAKVCRRGIR